MLHIRRRAETLLHLLEELVLVFIVIILLLYRGVVDEVIVKDVVTRVVDMRLHLVLAKLPFLQSYNWLERILDVMRPLLIIFQHDRDHATHLLGQHLLVILSLIYQARL